MKKVLFVLTSLMLSPVVMADSSSLTDGVKSVVSGAISSGKDALKGVKEGVEDGRKSGESLDGALIITDKESLEKYVTASVSKVEKLSNEEYRLTVVFRNKTDQIVRLTNLNEQKSLQLLDNDRFVSYLKGYSQSNGLDVTIPEQAAVRVRYDFDGVEGTPEILRLYMQEFKLPEVTKAAE